MAAQDDTKEQRLGKFKTDLQKLVDKTLVKGDAWYVPSCLPYLSQNLQVLGGQPLVQAGQEIPRLGRQPG